MPARIVTSSALANNRFHLGDRIVVSVFRVSALATQESRDRDFLPNAGGKKRIRMMEFFDIGAAWRLHQEQAADHGLAVVRRQWAGHHDLDVIGRRIGQECLVGVIVRLPDRQGAGAVESAA